MRWSFLFLFIFGLLAVPAAAQRPLSIVAAENFYGDVAEQIAGRHAAVSSVLHSPDQDPHLFEASPSVARLLKDAIIVVANGADYDPWMSKLLAATPAPGRSVIVVADLVQRKPGGNPHIWYDPPTMPAFARALAASLMEHDEAHASDYEQALQGFLASLQPMQDRVAELRRKYDGTDVTATEPVFGYMAAALGLRMRNERFQLAVMNSTEPRASDVSAFENDLRHHAVRVLFYNRQATEPAAQHFMHLAERSRIPVVGVTETEPPGQTYQRWMMGALEATAQALSRGEP
jgi:zinc/manganese transport system substrate-binding protein